jgi:hypothetical protein
MRTRTPNTDGEHRAVDTTGARCPECGSPLGDWRARIGYCCDYCLLRAEPRGEAIT